jgi:hypothetical protein
MAEPEAEKETEAADFAVLRPSSPPMARRCATLSPPPIKVDLTLFQ